MIANTATWVEVEVGNYVQGADGDVWRVDRKDYADGWWWFGMSNRGGAAAKVAMRPEDAATLMLPTLEEAEQIVASRLGVTGVQRRVIAMEIIASSPDSKNRRAVIAGHLLHHHGLSVAPTAHVENGDMAMLLHEHVLAHADPTKILVPHVHVAAHEL